MRRAFSLSILVLFFAGYAAAVDLENFNFSKDGLLKNTFISGDITYAIYAPADVNVFLLVKDVNLAGGETPESINNKIDALRVKLYPDKEFILDITAPRSTVMVGASRYKVTSFFNKVMAPGQSFSAQYWGWDVAVIAQTIYYGTCNWYKRLNSPWVLWGTVTGNRLHSGGLYGPEGVRGFKVTALTNIKADYVLWWFGD